MYICKIYIYIYIHTYIYIYIYICIYKIFFINVPLPFISVVSTTKCHSGIIVTL